MHSPEVAEGAALARTSPRDRWSPFQSYHLPQYSRKRRAGDFARCVRTRSAMTSRFRSRAGAAAQLVERGRHQKDHVRRCRLRLFMPCTSSSRITSLPVARQRSSSLWRPVQIVGPPPTRQAASRRDQTRPPRKQYCARRLPPAVGPGHRGDGGHNRSTARCRTSLARASAPDGAEMTSRIPEFATPDAYSMFCACSRSSSSAFSRSTRG